MLNSPKTLNYETRPLKFIERKMLLSPFSKICNYFNEPYQYIGLGGLSFTDFKLFHKELHIDEMHSIEGGGFSRGKIELNVPYSFIKLHIGTTTQKLTEIDLTKKSIIWLDYDDTLDNFFFQDLAIIFSKLPEGSIYLISCNKELKDNNTSEIYKKEIFEEKFETLTPFDLKQKDLATDSSHLLIRKMLISLIQKTLVQRNRTQKPVEFRQLFNILYQENRGAKMFTYGGIILDKESNFDIQSFLTFDYITTDDTAFKISAPNLTLKEMDALNCSLTDPKRLENFIREKIFSSVEIDKYSKTYKYMPTFQDVRL